MTAYWNLPLYAHLMYSVAAVTVAVSTVATRHSATVVAAAPALALLLLATGALAALVAVLPSRRSIARGVYRTRYLWAAVACALALAAEWRFCHTLEGGTADGGRGRHFQVAGGICLEVLHSNRSRQ